MADIEIGPVKDADTGEVVDEDPTDDEDQRDTSSSNTSSSSSSSGGTSSSTTSSSSSSTSSSNSDKTGVYKDDEGNLYVDTDPDDDWSGKEAAESSSGSGSSGGDSNNSDSGDSGSSNVVVTGGPGSGKEQTVVGTGDTEEEAKADAAANTDFDAAEGTDIDRIEDQINNNPASTGKAVTVTGGPGSGKEQTVVGSGESIFESQVAAGSNPDFDAAEGTTTDYFESQQGRGQGDDTSIQEAYPVQDARETRDSSGSGESQPVRDPAERFQNQLQSRDRDVTDLSRTVPHWYHNISALQSRDRDVTDLSAAELQQLRQQRPRLAQNAQPESGRQQPVDYVEQFQNELRQPENPQTPGLPDDLQRIQEAQQVVERNQLGLGTQSTTESVLNVREEGLRNLEALRRQKEVISSAPENAEFTTSEGETLQKDDALRRLDQEQRRLEQSLGKQSEEFAGYVEATDVDNPDQAQNRAEFRQEMKNGTPLADDIPKVLSTVGSEAAKVAKLGKDPREAFKEVEDEFVVQGMATMQKGQRISEDVQADIKNTNLPGKNILAPVAGGIATVGTAAGGLAVAAPGSSSKMLRANLREADLMSGERENPTVQEAFVGGGKMTADEFFGNPGDFVLEETGEELVETGIGFVVGGGFGAAAGAAPTIEPEITPNVKNTISSAKDKAANFEFKTRKGLAAGTRKGSARTGPATRNPSETGSRTNERSRTDPRNEKPERSRTGEDRYQELREYSQSDPRKSQGFSKDVRGELNTEDVIKSEQALSTDTPTQSQEIDTTGSDIRSESSLLSSRTVEVGAQAPSRPETVTSPAADSMPTSDAVAQSTPSSETISEPEMQTEAQADTLALPDTQFEPVLEPEVTPESQPEPEADRVPDIGLENPEEGSSNTGSKSSDSGSLEEKKEYQASLAAGLYDITAEEVSQDEFTGLEIRPLIEDSPESPQQASVDTDSGSVDPLGKDTVQA